jgi:hypothetical protein
MALLRRELPVTLLGGVLVVAALLPASARA